MRAPPRLIGERRVPTSTGTRAATPRAPRRASRRRFWWPSRQALQWSGIGMAATTVVAGLVWFAMSPLPMMAWGVTSEAALSLSAHAGFALREVYVEGRVETARERVLSALSVKIGEPLAGIDLEAARKRLVSLTWVKDVAIERRWPGTLFVRLTERQPMALWQRRGEIVVIDRDGAEITEAELTRFASLPLVVGDGAPEAAPTLLAIMATEPELRRRITAAIFVSGRRWTLRLNDAIDVHLPEEDTATAWARLSDIDRHHQLLERDVSTVDLRMPDRLILRTVRGLPTRKPPVGGRAT